jgi:ANTAR domain/GAF domain
VYGHQRSYTGLNCSWRIPPATDIIEVLVLPRVPARPSSTTGELSPVELTTMFAGIGARLAAKHERDAVLQLVTELAVRQVPGAEYAGITVGREGRRFRTIAPTDDLVHQIDQIQYDLHHGPCVDAILEDTSFVTGDLRTDSRWPDFGPRAVETTGVLSMLSLRLYDENDGGLIAGLNMYSRRPNAFSESSLTVAVLLATHGALAVGKAAAQVKVDNLMIALEHSREIGIAMGILMATERVTRDQAFDLLRIVSQHTHRKVSDLAAEVTETGALPHVPRSRPQQRPSLRQS